ncbi:MAG: hypothetical protein IJF97_00770 [Eggerthellaceae bacterium]|nr:hypothetical protein [Eggerthellaceae bacterium]MBQ3342675.1 hypothetical protein [Kiritimatiellia bacterium]
MAYELNTSYQTPSNICWLKKLGTKQYDYSIADTQIEVKPTVAPFRIAWKSYHGNFQVQYCIRRRQAPYVSAQAAGTTTYTDPDTGETYTTSAYDGEEVWVPWTGKLGTGHASTGSEVTWTDSAGRTWGPWQGNALSSSSPQPSPVELLTASQVDGWRTYELDMPFTYDLTYGGNVGTYDRNEYLVRVRAFNATQNNQTYKWNYGTWGEAVLTVAYMPVVTSMQGVRQADGSVEVHVESNWQHPVKFAAVTPLNSNLEVIQPDTFFTENIDPDVDNTGMGDYVFSVPEQYAPEIPDPSTTQPSNQILRFSYMTLFPDDYAYSWDETFASFTHDGGPLGTHIEVPIVEHADSQTPAQPTTTVDIDGNVTVSGGTYANVLTRVHWVDEDGRTYLKNVEMKQSGSNWIGKVDSPPIGVDIAVRTTVVASNGDWRTSKANQTIKSDASFMLDWNGEHFEMRYNRKYDGSIDREVEFVATDGRDVDVSRHARVSHVEYTVEGDVINPATGYEAADAWRSDVNKLRAHHDWNMRMSGGFSRRVAITSVSTSAEYPTNDKFMHVSISMREVS